MATHRSDRVVRILTAIVSIGWYGLWVAAAIALILAPNGKLVVGDDPDWTMKLGSVGITLPEKNFRDASDYPGGAKLKEFLERAI